MPYYALPIAARVRSPFHPWLKPAGYIGQSAGLLALTIFLFLWLYPLRKKFRWLAFTGTIAKWLNVHVLTALALPLLVAVHAAWRFDGVIGLGFWSMMVVWASGIVGRYLYARIPRSKAGVELTMEEIGTQRKALLELNGGGRQEWNPVADPPTTAWVTWLGADLDLDLARSWYLLMSVNQETGGFDANNQIYGGVSYPF
jgi:hypothetical protein